MRTQDDCATTTKDSPQRAASVSFSKATPLYVISLLILVIVIVGFVWHDLRTEYHATLARWDVQLSGSADDRVKVSALWLKERRTDTFSVAGNHDVIHLLSVDGSDANLAETRIKVEQSIARVTALNGFLGGALGDRDCRIVLQVSLRPEMARGLQAACQAAQHTGEFRVDTSGAEQGHVWLDLSAPVMADGQSASSGRPPRQIVGSVIMVTENWRDIFPIFASEGLPAPASETLIVWKKGDDANIFSPRLNAQSGESFFRRPLTGSTFESRVARDGDVPFGEFIDYRGKRVLGVARRIGVANYSLVRKVDYDAALAEQRRRDALEELLGALSILLFGIVMVALHRDAAARDWKERVRQEEALHKSQALTNAIVNSTSDMIWSVDPDTFGLLTFNRGLADYYLHRRGILLRTGMPQEKLFADQDYLDHWRELYQRALAEGSFTTDYNVSAGTNILQLTFNLLKRDGKVFGISVFGKDITERKVMEESLRESEERYRRLFEVESDAILVVDVGTCRLMDANPAALKMYGYSREEFQSLTAPEVSAEPETTRIAIAEGQSYIPLRWHRKKDGTIFPVEITGNFFFSEGRRIHVAAIRDITDRQRAEEALQLTQFSMKHASDGIFWVNPNGRILYANEAACRSLEYSREELLSLSISDIDPLFPRDTWGAHWEKTKRLGSITFETQNRARTGRVFSVEITVNYLEFGGKEYNFAFVRNISERKRIEQALRDSEQRYRDFIEHSKEGVWRLEFDQPIPVDLPGEEIVERVLRYGYVAECNLAYARDIGFSTPEEIVGKHLGELIPLSDQERWESYRVSTRGGLMARTVEFRSRGGSNAFRHFLRAEVPIVQNGMLVRLWGITRDITELREAETSLRESEERFRATFENAGVGMALVDLQGHPFKSNPALRQMLGYSEEELSRMDFTQFTYPDDRELDWRLYSELAAGQRDNYEIEKRYLKKDGSLMWGHLTVSLINGKDGRPAHCVGMVQDVTERKRAGEALRESEERFRSLVENNTVGIYRTTPEGRILMANSALIGMLGYTSFETLAARNLEDAGFEPGYPRQVFHERMEREGEVRGLEERWRRQDGSVIFVRESARAVRNPEGKTLYYDGVVEDITGEKQAEAEHVRLVTAIEQSAEAVVITNPAGEIEYINPAFTRITGYSREEVLGGTPKVLKSGQHEPEFYQQLWQTILKGQPWHGEIINKRKDGSLYTELMTVTPVRGDHGEITHFIATKQDVTERRALESQLHQAAKMEAVGRLAGEFPTTSTIS
jgi:PAS domain S-box-containing protein